MVLVRSHPSSVSVGDVVQLDHDPTDATPGVVHRVVEVDGANIRTRGDANAAADPGWTPVTEVQGVVVGALRGPAADAYAAFRSPFGQATAAALAVMLLWPAQTTRSRSRKPGRTQGRHVHGSDAVPRAPGAQGGAVRGAGGPAEAAR